MKATPYAPLRYEAFVFMMAFIFHIYYDYFSFSLILIYMIFYADIFFFPARVPFSRRRRFLDALFISDMMRLRL